MRTKRSELSALENIVDSAIQITGRHSSSKDWEAEFQQENTQFKAHYALEGRLSVAGPTLCGLQEGNLRYLYP